MAKVSVSKKFDALKDAITAAPIDSINQSLNLHPTDDQATILVLSSTILDEDMCAAVEAVGKELGVSKPAEILELYPKEESYSVGFPRVYSNGNPCLRWGPTEYPLAGDIEKGSIVLSEGNLRLKAEVGDNVFQLFIPISLQFEGEDGRKQARESLSNCSTWEEAQEFLSLQVPILKRKQIIEEYAGKELSLHSFDIREGNNGEYLVVRLKTATGAIFAIFASDKNLLADGDTFIVKESGIHYKKEGFPPLEMGGFMKLHELELGVKYSVTEVKETTGEYKGYNLNIAGVGVVSSNKQFDNWFISQGKPQAFVLKVVKKKKLSGGRFSCKLQLVIENQGALDGLLPTLKKSPSPPKNTIQGGASQPETPVDSNDLLGAI